MATLRLVVRGSEPSRSPLVQRTPRLGFDASGHCSSGASRCFARRLTWWRCSEALELQPAPATICGCGGREDQKCRGRAGNHDQAHGACVAAEYADEWADDPCNPGL